VKARALKMRPINTKSVAGGEGGGVFPEGKKLHTPYLRRAQYTEAGKLGDSDQAHRGRNWHLQRGKKNGWRGEEKT